MWLERNPRYVRTIQYSTTYSALSRDYAWTLQPTIPHQRPLRNFLGPRRRYAEISRNTTWISEAYARLYDIFLGQYSHCPK
ncbi:hypothetical protein COCMIDRAFT_101648 [Bipolaris oryzae ATCC 44560]|uniref:Uncharacterized protein n=1 Tax=Bipolaris oryzae ATCC 44560 TaxID=930090 RepID=W6YZX6_COCMI|nr:uncharacterized protein COCMIDRAFT_101648 [Bipolaris oryzae ATCC 44560]EUC43143.1 hypothetical protein COCMIDRAFT_101648 [Bipolaris oryzae ATCC 44560]